jgi:hypothetical protein
MRRLLPSYRAALLPSFPAALLPAAVLPSLPPSLPSKSIMHRLGTIPA